MPNDDTKQPKNNNDQPLTVNTVQPVKDIVNPSPIGLSGSAAPADDVLMPLTVAASQPRKKFAGGKIIATILGLFLLVGGVGAGVYLTGQNQNPQEKADDILYRYEKICTKAGSPRAWCVDETRTECPNDPGSPRSCTDSFWNSWSCSGDEREPCGGQGGGGGGGTPSCPAGTTYVCGTPAQTFCPTFNTCDFPNKNTGIWCDQTGSENNGNLKDWYLCQTNCSCQPPATLTPTASPIIVPTGIPGGTPVPVPTPTVTPTATPPTSCNKKLDIALVIDRSSTMTQTESDGRKKLDWAKDAAKGFVQAIQNTNTTSVKVAVSSFGAQGNDGTGTLDATYNSTLNSPLTNNFTGVIGSISNIAYTKPGTCVECGLRIGNNQLTNNANKRVVVLLSDGMANHSWNGSTNTDDITNAINEANRGRSNGIEYRSVGYGSLTAGQINENTLLQIAGEPRFYQYKPNVSDWSGAFLRILGDLCDTNPTPPPPTSIILTPIEDSYVDSGTLANTNYGTSPALALDGSPIKMALMKFDLTSLANRAINSALLKVKITDSSTGPYFVKKVTGTWNENTVTYNTRPALGNFTTSFRDGTAGTYMFVNLTQFVNENKGTMASFNISETNSDGLQFNSREATADKPQLIIR